MKNAGKCIRIGSLTAVWLLLSMHRNYEEAAPWRAGLGDLGVCDGDVHPTSEGKN